MVRKGGQLKVHARSTWGEGGVKKGQTMVHMVCVWPLRMSIFSRRLTDVTLLTQDENTILSKIRYPDLPGSVLYGHLKFPNSRVKPYKLVLGIASVARPPGVDYLTKVSHI